MAINYSQFPFNPMMQKNPMSLLANPAQTAMQQRNSTGLLNLNPMQVQQARMRKGVADAEALNKRQMRGNMFMALGDAFAGREMNANFLARQQHFEAQKAAEEKRKQGLALGESAYDYILKETGNADMAMLVKNNPALATEVMKNRFAKPKERRIVLQNGIQYYADSMQPVIENPVAPERKYAEGADGYLYYTDGDKERVFPDNLGPSVDPTEEKKIILTQRDKVEKQYKPANEIVTGYRKLEDALLQEDGSAGYAALVLFMKNLDGSVVKEGEVAAFGRAQGLLGSLENSLSTTKGEGMTKQMRLDILNLAKKSTQHVIDAYDFYLKGTQEGYDLINLPYEPIFSGYRINREGLDLAEQNLDFFNPRTKVVAPIVGTIKDGYRFKGGDPNDQNNWEKVS